MENKILGKIGNNNDVFISLSEFSGKKYLDIRKYYDSNGEMLPTKKGITLNFEQIDELRGVLNNNFEEIESYFK